MSFPTFKLAYSNVNLIYSDFLEETSKLNFPVESKR